MRGRAHGWASLVSPSAVCARSCSREPVVEVCGGQHAQDGLHAVVAEAADLGAEDGVVAGKFRREVDVLRLAGDGVLLEAELGDGEAVDDIDGAQSEVDLAAGGKDELGADDVVGGMRIGGIEADGIAFGGGDECVARAAEGLVMAGVAEVPGELQAGDLDLKRVGRGAGVALRGPEGVRTHGEEEEERGEAGEREVLECELVDAADARGGARERR